MSDCSMHSQRASTFCFLVEFGNEEADAYFEALMKAQGTLRGKRATVESADKLEKLAGRLESARQMADKYEGFRR
jgi:hypothetical protein